MVKVLIIHQHFKTPDSGGPIRSYYLAKALVSNNIPVTVITTDNIPSRKISNYEGIEVRYLPIPYDNKFGFYRRAWSFLRFVIDATQEARQVKGVTLCYAISTPLTVGLIALRLRASHAVRYIFEVGDLWPDAPIQLGLLKNNIVIRSFQSLERNIYQRAARIIALSKPIAEAIRAKTPVVVDVIPNMADVNFFQPSHPTTANESFVVSYIGAVGYANGLDYVLDCARVCQKAGLKIQFNICGDGALLESLKNNAARLKLTNLVFKSFTNREGVREILRQTDACLISYRPEKILETGSPNKYFDALAAGKLVIVNFGGWIKEEIENQRCGIYVSSREPQQFVEAIKPFLSKGSVYLEYAANARQLAERSYSRGTLSHQFVEIVRAETLKANP